MKMELKKWHILLLIVGIVFIFLSVFHTTLWFDETYSVAIANHSFSEIWTIGGHDVHPVLYYWMLKVVSLIFGNSILVFRIFSAVGIAVLGILGYTHIRKDFGEKTGILFSFFSYFLPVMVIYAGEIRMYSWTLVMVTLMAIYAWRLLKNSSIKNWILFGIFSLAGAYMHYYGLLAAGIINVALFVYLIVKRKEQKGAMKKFLIVALVQVALYIPWLIYFVGQFTHVSNGFWIKIDPIETPVTLLEFQFKGYIESTFAFDVDTIISLTFAVLLYGYMGYSIYRCKKNKEDIKPGIAAICVYVGVILAALIISFKANVLFCRYLITLTGLLAFFLAFFLAKEKRKSIVIGICTIVFVMAVVENITAMIKNYDPNNITEIKYIEENIQEGDIIVYSNIGNGSIIAANFRDNKQYFINGAGWDVEEAYKAYGPQMETITNFDNEKIKNYKGRIWLIDSEHMGLYEEFPKEGITTLLEAKRFDTKYHDYIYNVMLIEKQ